MRTRLGLLALLPILFVASFGGASASAAGYASCSGGYNPDGTPGSFYRAIKAKRVACPAARSVVKAWVVAHSDGSDNPTKASTAKGFTCRGRATSSSADDPDGGLAVTCKRAGGSKVVKFYGHP